MEESQLHIVDLKSKDMLRKIENGIVYGLPVLLQDVLEELGNREVLRLGDKELDYNKETFSVCREAFIFGRYLKGSISFS